MRLTKILREAFVRSAMNDVPEIDYCEQIIKLAMDAAVAAMPQDVKAIYLKYPEYMPPVQHKAGKDENYRDYTYVYVPMPEEKPFPKAMNTAVVELLRLQRDQASARSRLENQLKAVADSMTTRKALAEALPEFAKYLPEEMEKSSMLPAVANTVADFVRAGWPKGRVAA